MRTFAIASLAVVVCVLHAQSLSVQTVAGTDAVGEAAQGTSVILRQVRGIAAGPGGTLFIADTDGHRVHRLEADGTLSTIAGIGRAGYSGDGGPAGNAALNAPYGLAVDKSGALYIADLGNRRIRRVSPDGTISTVAGGGAVPPSLAEGGQASEIALDSPRNVAVDPAGNLYFSDFGGHRVWQVTTSGTLSLVAGTGRPAFSGDTGASWVAEVNSPAGIAADGWGALYVADSGNHRIRRVYRGVIATLPIAPATPTGIAVDLAGDLLIADPGGNQIIRYSAGVAAATVQPAGDITVDAAGNVFVADGRFVRRLNPVSGQGVVVAGSAPMMPVGPATEIRLWSPNGVAHDGLNLYLADTANNRVLSVGADGRTALVAGTGTRGASVDGEVADVAQLDTPWGIAASGDTVYIADRGNHTVRAVSRGTIRTVAGMGEAGYTGDFGPSSLARLRSPTFLALDATGNLYISDTGNHCVRRISNSGAIETVAGDGTAGFGGDGGAAVRSRLNAPLGLAVAGDGTLFIADSGNNRIRRIRKSGELRDPFIDSIPDAPIWRNPTGLAFASDGALLITDSDDQRVYRLEPDSGRVSTVAGTGDAGFAGDSGPAQSSMWNRPAGIATAPDRATYVADSGNDRIRAIAATKVGPPVVETPQNLIVLHGATLLPGPVAPGELVTFATPSMPTAGDRVSVLVNREEVRVLEVNGSNLTIQVPPSVAGSAAAALEVRVGSKAIGGANLAVVAATPEFFKRQGTQAAALNEDGSPNTPETPAARGSIVTLFATGDGDGPVEVRFVGYMAELLYSGPAPGFPGLTQVNARVPGGFLAPGQVPLTIAVGEIVSQSETCVSVR